MAEVALAVEEMALIFSLMGRPEAGHALMANQLGEMTEAEARARLLAAGHSLIARGLLALGNEGPILESSLARLMEQIARPQFSIRYSRATREAEFALVYHFGPDAVLEHRLEQGVVHHLAEVPDASAVVKGGMLFYEIPQTPSVALPPTPMALQVLMDAKDIEDPAGIEERLRRAGVPDEVRSLLAEDLAHPQYRGGVIRVDYDGQGRPSSERGFLLLRGSQRLWLISPEARDAATALLMPATLQSFHQAVMALL